MTAAYRGIPFVVSGPSGVGKSTIVRRVLEADPQVRFSVSHTTRGKREGEKEGVDYFFVDHDEFVDLMRRDTFLEHAAYNGKLYGTSKAAVLGPTEQGFDLILEVEIQGASQLEDRLPEAVRIFIEPPSFDVLEERLRNRNTETDYTMRYRLERAREEVEYAKHCHHRIVNDSVDKAVDQFLHIIRDARKERR